MYSILSIEFGMSFGLRGRKYFCRRSQTSVQKFVQKLQKKILLHQEDLINPCKYKYMLGLKFASILFDLLELDRYLIESSFKIIF